MTVARPSTPASYFHLLRRQAYARPRRPLIVFTPKAMLRLRGASSEVADFTSGKFEPVLDDPRMIAGADRSAVKRVVLTSGKIYYDILAEVEKRPEKDIAIVRLEQLYPLPADALNSTMAQYPNADVVWTQDEPENQGAWPYLWFELGRNGGNAIGGRSISVASRPASASPATGSSKRSAHEQADLIERALTIQSA
jgi:2-oxoglutarate dehydrogenase E1 component